MRSTAVAGGPRTAEFARLFGYRPMREKLMDQRPTGEISRTVNSLAELRFSELTLDSLLGHIGRFGVEVLEGWEAAGTSLVEGDRVATFGMTDDRVRDIDQAQYDQGIGPCVDAIMNSDSFYYDGTDVEPRWRQFAEAAGSEGIYSVLSVPLQLDGETVGALNFYSGERDALRPGQREEALLFASQAAVSIANVKELVDSRAQADQLGAALQTRTMIGQATGLLMAQESLSSEEAFQKLVRVSQSANVKLREIAQRYVEAWEQRAYPK